MSSNAGPDIVQDGLVFKYDTGDGKSFKGEPTTNLITSNGIDFSQMSTYGTLIRSRVSDSNSPSGYACEMEYPNSSLNSASRIRFGDSTNIPASGNAFVSIMAKFEGGPSSNIYPRIYSGNSWQTLAPLDGGLTYLTSEYRRFGVNAYLGTGSGGPLPAFSMTQSNSNNQAGQKTRWHSPQVELKSHATPFVNGTRSATQGLLDRAGNLTIDLSNVSFDSNAQMTFDGTDDYLDCGDIGISSSKVTFAAWVKPSSGSIRHIIDASGNACHLAILANKPYFWNGATYHTDADVITNGVWYYLTGVQSDTNDIYINGVLSSSKASNRTISVSNVNIGRWQNGNTRYFNGDVAVAQIYNRALTAKEVLQNYQATRSRFS